SEQGIPFLRAARSPSNLADYARRHLNRQDLYTLQAEAYSLVAANHFDKAIVALENLVTSCADESTPWVQDIAGRATNLVNVLRNERTAGLRQLQEWELKTKEHLGLQDIE